VHVGGPLATKAQVRHVSADVPELLAQAVQQRLRDAIDHLSTISKVSHTSTSTHTHTHIHAYKKSDADSHTSL
jgi:transposase